MTAAELRALCVAVVETYPLWVANHHSYKPYLDAEFALLVALSIYDDQDVYPVPMANTIIAALDAEREAGRAEERDRLMARLHAIGSDAIESYRRSRTPRAEGGMDALLTAADILADEQSGPAAGPKGAPT